MPQLFFASLDRRRASPTAESFTRRGPRSRSEAVAELSRRISCGVLDPAAGAACRTPHRALRVELDRNARDVVHGPELLVLVHADDHAVVADLRILHDLDGTSLRGAVRARPQRPTASDQLVDASNCFATLVDQSIQLILVGSRPSLDPLESRDRPTSPPRAPSQRFSEEASPTDT